MSLHRWVCLALAALLSTNVYAFGIIDKNVPNIAYVSFLSPDLTSPSTPLTLTGQLRIPNSDQARNENGLPAVVVLHGSAGIDSRGRFYIEALNRAGIATLEVDMWTPRGVTGGLDRPPLPTLTVPDAFSALAFLAAHPEIDGQRIGLVGFSWGGAVTMLAATNFYTQQFGGGHRFAAHVAHYPVCWAYSAGFPGVFFYDLTGEPVLIQIGDRDDYDEGAGPCQALAAGFDNVEVAVYRNAYHAWDRLEPPITVQDPLSHLGAGGAVRIAPNPGSAFQSRRRMLQFLEQALAVQ